MWATVATVSTTGRSVLRAQCGAPVLSTGVGGRVGRRVWRRCGRHGDPRPPAAPQPRADDHRRELPAAREAPHHFSLIKARPLPRLRASGTHPGQDRTASSLPSLVGGSRADPDPQQQSLPTSRRIPLMPAPPSPRARTPRGSSSRSSRRKAAQYRHPHAAGHIWREFLHRIYQAGQRDSFPPGEICYLGNVENLAGPANRQEYAFRLAGRGQERSSSSSLTARSGRIRDSPGIPGFSRGLPGILPGSQIPTLGPPDQQIYAPAEKDPV